MPTKEQTIRDEMIAQIADDSMSHQVSFERLKGWKVRYWLSTLYSRDAISLIFILKFTVKIVKISEPKLIGYIYCGSVNNRLFLLHSICSNFSIPRSSRDITSRPEPNGYMISVTPDGRSGGYMMVKYSVNDLIQTIPTSYSVQLCMIMLSISLDDTLHIRKFRNNIL